MPTNLARSAQNSVLQMLLQALLEDEGNVRTFKTEVDALNQAVAQKRERIGKLWAALAVLEDE